MCRNLSRSHRLKHTYTHTHIAYYKTSNGHKWNSYNNKDNDNVVVDNGDGDGNGYRMADGEAGEKHMKMGKINKWKWNRMRERRNERIVCTNQKHWPIFIENTLRILKLWRLYLSGIYGSFAVVAMVLCCHLETPKHISTTLEMLMMTTHTETVLNVLPEMRFWFHSNGQIVPNFSIPFPSDDRASVWKSRTARALNNCFQNSICCRWETSARPNHISFSERTFNHFYYLTRRAINWKKPKTEKKIQPNEDAKMMPIMGFTRYAFITNRKSDPTHIHTWCDNKCTTEKPLDCIANH